MKKDNVPKNLRQDIRLQGEIFLDPKVQKEVVEYFFTSPIVTHCFFLIAETFKFKISPNLRIHIFELS
jgi:hypothetical protein